MDELQKSMYDVYVFETTGFLGKLDDLLLQSERNNADILECVPEIFRIMHTIKSSSAMMSFDHVSKLAHSVEDLFSYIREHHPENIDKSELTDIVLSCSDFIKRSIDPDVQEDPSGHIQRVTDYLDLIKHPTPPEPKAAAQPVKLRVRFKQDCRMVSLRSFELQHKLSRSVESITAVPDGNESGADERIRQDGLLLTITSGQSADDLIVLARAMSPFIDHVEIENPPPQPPAAPPLDPPAPAESKSDFVERRTDTTRRGTGLTGIAMSKVDELVDLSCELLIAHLGLRHAYEQGQREPIEQSMDALEKLILGSQQASLAIRMVPLTDTIHKLNRGLRDMARKQGKDVEFITYGEDAEVDRSIVDELFTPLMHITRNALDHGIETPAERIQASKSPCGRIEVWVTARDNDVVIAVVDDGRGFDRPRILKRAVSLGLVTEQQAAVMADADIDQLVYTPGFSTREDVTEYSGRGVGMDVVNESIKKLNGRLKVSSTAGQGARIEFTIPLTLTILNALIVRTQEERCALPIGAVREIFVPENRAIRTVNGRDTILHRAYCYPIVRLSEFYDEPNQDYAEGVMLLIKEDTGDYVLFVSEVLDNRNIVVKPIPGLLRSIKQLYGCTILGDGQICLILKTSGFEKGNHHDQ